MAVFLLIALIAFPIAEIAVLIAVGGEIGVLATVAWLVLAAIGGIALIRVQGIATLFRVRTALDRGEPPEEAMFHGACLVVAGLLLIVPGFLTDLLALAIIALLPLRNLVRRWLWQRAGAHRGYDPARQGPTIIEGEYETIDETAADPHSPWRRGDDTLPPRPRH